MESGLLEFEGSQVHFLRFGQGERLLVAFPGFAERATMFGVLEPALAESHTVYALDLPWHGRTAWVKNEYRRRDISALLTLILQREGRERLELMGFSFGGRVALALLPEWLSRLDRLWLLAPDGLRTPRMFSALVTPVWFRRWAARQLERPEHFHRIVGWLHRKGLISRFLHRFVMMNTATERRRRRLFGTWLSMDDFVVRRRVVKKLLASSGLQAGLFYGRLDRVVPAGGGKWLAAGLPNVQLHWLDAGHDGLVGEELCGKIFHL